ncbi:RNA-binding protein squid [Aphelenchoides besseyi]|nr:RNA-binding protein squid [Aphelenchoides besseyi]KAI6200185.1 RNA-binding protein squid [Aphelenchoides besseyi]
MPGDNEINNGGDGQKGAEDRKIFVGGIAAEVTNDDLIQYFSQFGEVAQAQVKIDRTTGRSRGFAFVEFATADACKGALQKREQNIKNKPCEVKPAKSRENKKVFVGGLPADHPEEELRKYFEQYGKVDDVEWPYDKQTKVRRNFAFIVFEEEDAADRAAAQSKHMFSERECDVKKAVPQNRRFNNRFANPMTGGPRGAYGAGGMRAQMPTHGGAPWNYGGWNQMAGMYGSQGTPSNSWNDWYSTGGGYYQGQQNPNAYSGYGGGYDYSQNGANNRAQGQNGSVGHYRNN